MKMRTLAALLAVGILAPQAHAGVFGLFGKKGKRLPEAPKYSERLKKVAVIMSHPYVAGPR
jgi:hypothetical protein